MWSVMLLCTICTCITSADSTARKAKKASHLTTTPSHFPVSLKDSKRMPCPNCLECTSNLRKSERRNSLCQTLVCADRKSAWFFSSPDQRHVPSSQLIAGKRFAPCCNCQFGTATGGRLRKPRQNLSFRWWNRRFYDFIWKKCLGNTYKFVDFLIFWKRLRNFEERL